MSARKKEVSSIKIITGDCILTILIFMALMMILSLLVYNKKVTLPSLILYIPVIIFLSCSIATVIVKTAVKTQIIYSLASSGIIILIFIIAVFAQKESGLDMKTILTSSITVALGKTIPIVINRGKKHKSKRK